MSLVYFYILFARLFLVFTKTLNDFVCLWRSAFFGDRNVMIHSFDEA